MRSNTQEKQMEFSRSIIEGVEIKRCQKSPHAFKPHVHHELSLGYIVNGSTDLTLNDKTIHYRSGDGVIIPPLMTHRCAPNDVNDWAYIMLFVDPGYYRDVVSFRQASKLTGDHVRRLVGFIEQLLIEEAKDTLESILIELLLEFGEHDMAEDTEADIDDIVAAIHDYILNHIYEDITLGKLQQISGLNKFAIIRNFKRFYTATPAAYHRQCRVAEAKRLLNKGADVFSICEDLGFYDQAHLIREFKKMYGITPGTYIEQLKR